MKELFKQHDNKLINTALSLLKGEMQAGRIWNCAIGSNSMAPFLKRGDIVSVKHVCTENLRKGDIIVYRKGEELLTHRYIHSVRLSPYHSVFITKGDNAPRLDPSPVSSDQVIGKVIKVQKKERAIDLERFRWKLTNVLLAALSPLRGRVRLGMDALKRHNKKTDNRL